MATIKQIHQRKYKPQELQTAIDRYFESCHDQQITPVWEELLNALDITANTWDSYKQGLSDEETKIDTYTLTDKEREYINNKILVSEIIKKAEQRLTAAIVRQAFDHPNLSTMAIYLTKQKHYGGYIDRQVTEGNGKLDLSISLKTPDGETFKPDK